MNQQGEILSSSASSSEGRRLTRLYVLALSTVALLSIGAQWLVQRQLDRGERDSYVINIAGRQRMLSQQLTKSSLQLARASGTAEVTLRANLSRTLDEWQSNHEMLRHGTSDVKALDRNSHEVEQLFSEIEPEYQAMLGAGRAIQSPDTDVASQLATMEQHEGEFLKGMDRIVSQYVFEAEAKVRWLRRLEFLLLGLTLLVLATEGLLIFRPAVRRIEQTVAYLARTTEGMIDARDKAEQANAAKSRFLASISHELRTPMMAVLGMAELAEHTSDVAKRKEYLTTILDAGNSLLALLNDLIDLSAMDANELRLSERPFASNEWGGRVVTLLQPLAEAKGLVLAYETDLVDPTWVLGDEHRVQQVLVNLVANAIKYTETGNVIVRCETAEVTADVSRLQWSVTDTGCGIALADQQRAFEPFTQITSSSGTSRSGIGLGLSICKRIVEAMGGEIQLESTPGVGTCVRFSAPFLRVASVPPSTQTDAVISTRPLRVLVVEDTEVNQVLLRELLARAGHHVVVAGSGEEAVDAYRCDWFDCVLLDLYLPGMDGQETKQLMERMDDDCARCVPKICITAEGNNKAVHEFDAFLSKPFTGRDLQAAITSVMQAISADCAEAEQTVTSDLWDELAKTYLRVASSQTESLLSAIDQRNWNSARILAHRLRGQIGYFAAESLVRDLEKLEQACVAKNAILANKLWPVLQEKLTALAASLERQCGAVIEK